MHVLSSIYVKRSNDFLLNMTVDGTNAKHLLLSIWFLLIVDATSWVCSTSTVVSQVSTSCATTDILSGRRKLELFGTLKTRVSASKNDDDVPISNKNEEATSRRSFFSSTVPFCCAASTLCGIVSILEDGEQDAVAWAAAPPLSYDAGGDVQLQNQEQQQLQAAFQDIQEELDGEVFIDMGKGGGVLFLKQLIVDERWDTIKEFTKFYDAEFRKVKLGKVRKLLTDKKLKEEALQLSNAITFDLIGINKASRIKDVNEAIRYWAELEEDIIKFLQLQKQVI